MAAPLLDLPRELRDLIYKFYITTEGGYIYNHRTGKFRHADDHLIDLSLSLTCKQVANEMRGLALETNILTFKTWRPDNFLEREGTAVFSSVLKLLNAHRERSLLCAWPCYVPDTFKFVGTAYPQFLPLLEFYRAGILPGSVPRCGVTPSIQRAFVKSTLDTLSGHPDFIECVKKALAWRTGREWDAAGVAEYLAIQVQPWEKPSDVEFARMFEILQPSEPYLDIAYMLENDRYSAAMIASRYLGTLPSQTLRHIRHIVLHEDLNSSAQPECHAQALIPFCQENPNIRIERRVDLWNNIFRAAIFHRGITNNFKNILLSCDISKALALWIMEADALPAHGMPSHTFTLTIDGSVDAEASSNTFDILRRDCAWQEALEKCYERGDIATPSWTERRAHQCFILENLSLVVKGVIKKQSLVRCNFNTGEVWDIDKVLEDNRTLSLSSWSEKWMEHSPPSFQPPPRSVM